MGVGVELEPGPEEVIDDGLGLGRRHGQLALGLAVDGVFVDLGPDHVVLAGDLGHRVDALVGLEAGAPQLEQGRVVAAARRGERVVGLAERLVCELPLLLGLGLGLLGLGQELELVGLRVRRGRLLDRSRCLVLVLFRDLR